MARTLKKKDIEAALLAKGFGKKNRGHRVLHYYHGGRKTHITTWLSHSSQGRDVGKPLVGAMARQCRLTKSEFESFVDCEMTGSDYYDVLRAKKEL